jgi:hypothetical protein
MRRAPAINVRSRHDRRLDRQLLASILLSPLAAGINTIVGYTVAHRICDVNRKTTGYIVSAFDIGLCVLAALLAFTAQHQLEDGGDNQPEAGRRRFMAKMGLILSAFAALVVFAGTLAILTLHPCD